MPRLKRVHLKNVLSYVTACGDEERPLFEDADDYCAYLRLVHQYREQYGMKLYAYCLLPDQVHMCVEPMTEEGTLSSFMHDVSSRYTKYYNKRYNKTGHLFQARFKSTIIEQEQYLLPLTVYVHRLPLVAGLVDDDPAEYAFSSLSDYVGITQTSIVDLSAEIRELNSWVLKESSTKSYIEYFKRIPVQAMDDFVKELRHRVIGTESFVTDIKRRLDAPQPKRPQQKRKTTANLSFWQMPTVRFALGASFSAILMVTGGLLATQRTQASMQQVPVTSPVLADGVDMDSLMLQFKTALQEYEKTQPQQVAALRKHPEQLAGSEWVIEIIASEGGADESLRDYLVFENNEVVSLRFNAKGFPNARYTLRGQNGGTRIWKAMQTGPNGEVITWRGEISPQGMKGVLTKQVSGQAAENYSFEGKTRKRTEI